ncbi:MAG: NmrA/HSCARG family protein [Chloroflexi bacterium]|nr:MAG: NmrA/HSCARG family protein [Chloroflexota bacterium]
MVNGSLMDKTFVVTGATGRQGSAVVRHLIQAGARVKALTRNPSSPKAQKIKALGAELITADMANLEALKILFQGAEGVYSVQNPYTSSFTAEVRQGKNVAEAAKAAGVAHVVQASTGFGKKTGIPSWDSKLEIEEYMRSLGLPFTVLRPTAFMEIISDPSYYPMASVFHVMPKLMGADKKLPWLAVDDLGAIAAKVFADPGQYIGQDLKLTSDLRSINEVRELYRQVLGKKAPHFPMPVFLFRKFTGDDLIIMWKYLGDTSLDASTDLTYAILPEAQTVRTWLARQKDLEN